MRPRQSSLGIFGESPYWDCAEFMGFNEAEAIKPRNHARAAIAKAKS